MNIQFNGCQITLTESLAVNFSCEDVSSIDKVKISMTGRVSYEIAGRQEFPLHEPLHIRRPHNSLTLGDLQKYWDDMQHKARYRHGTA